MLSNDLNNTDIVVQFDYGGEIETFSNMNDLIHYMNEEMYLCIHVMQCNYWGTCVINNEVELKKNGDKFYLG